MLENFEPNLIPNNKKGTPTDFDTIIKKNGGYSKYVALYKKDGCRLGIHKEIKTRSLKAPKSELVLERFKRLTEICVKENIFIEGEFYMHGLKFNQIFSFFSNTNVESPKYRERLEKMLAKGTGSFIKKYETTDIDALTTFHAGLRFWLFDGIVLDRPELTGWLDRMRVIVRRLEKYDISDILELPEYLAFSNFEELQALYDNALHDGWEGLVIVKKDHVYKYGRNSLKQGTLLKMKDDAREFDGIILGVEEGTRIKDGVERGQNELGRSTTSQKKGDREPNGKAKGFIIQYEDKGTFTVGLKGFDDEAKRELLENADKYIGQHFKYTAMAPTKDFPRHAYFDCWRDDK